MPNPFDQVITVYGRKAVLEALRDPGLECHRLHLANSNKPAPILAEMEALAAAAEVEILRHGKRELSRISRKGSQDQGVALDVMCPDFCALDDFLARPQRGRRLLAADGITNPQNVGMLVRSAVAGGIDGILWPKAGNAALGPLAIKASAGTLFRAPLIRCRELDAALRDCQRLGYRICVLDAAAPQSIFEDDSDADSIYVLGNETSGVSGSVAQLADIRLRIPMQAGVESLNVAVTAALIAYLDK